MLEGVPFSAVVLDRHGSLLRLGLAADQHYRVFTPLKDISPLLIEATLLYEDKRFLQHSGVSLPALFRAAFNTYLVGERRMGASTITMQLARLRLKLDTGGITGKLRQMERALAYERYYSKKEILEAYLNLAPYGGNIEGCGAAGRIYYHKAPAGLTLPEALSLAAVPQNPARRSPLVLRRQPQTGAAIRQRMFKLWLKAHPEDKGSAFLAELQLPTHSPAELPFLAPHVSAEALARYGERAGEIKTTLDLRLQRRLEDMIRAMVERSALLGVDNAGALLAHWPSMEVRALAGSADFFKAEINGQVDGSRARRSPGSTLKPFIYALALDQGLIHPLTLLYDAPRSFGGYDPENADQRFLGPLSAAEALRLSRNIPAIALAERLGAPTRDMPPQASGRALDLYEFLRLAGVEFDYSREHYGLALVLGGAEVSMREIASLYALLANRGRPGKLSLFQAEKSVAPAPGQGLLSPEACVLTLDMLRARPALDSGYGLSLLRRLPMYWKTGTSNGSYDAWTAGIFGPYVLVVWVGSFERRSNPTFSGARTAAPLFRDIADAVYALEKTEDMAMRGLEGLNISRVKVCGGTGDLNVSLCPDTRETLFIPGVSPIADSGVYRQILLDKASGLRACVDTPGRTERVLWEFWPTDLQRVFRRAGIIKPPPPPFLPECGVAAAPGGLPPEILSPKPGVVYHRSLSLPAASTIALSAAGDADVTDFFWFSGEAFIGRASSGEELLWSPPGGRSLIRVVDNFGRSRSRELRVELTE